MLPAVSEGKAQLPPEQTVAFFTPAAVTDQVDDEPAADRHSSAHTKWSKVVPDQWTSIVVAPTLLTTPYQISTTSPLGLIVKPADLALCHVIRPALSVIEVTCEEPWDGAVWAISNITSPAAAVVTDSVVLCC